MKTAHVDICFDMEKLGEKGLKTLFEIEKKFREIGVTFDTGAGFGSRDWQWDFSLEGPVKVILIKEVDHNDGDPEEEHHY